MAGKKERKPVKKRGTAGILLDNAEDSLKRLEDLKKSGKIVSYEAPINLFLKAAGEYETLGNHDMSKRAFNRAIMIARKHDYEIPERPSENYDDISRRVKTSYVLIIIGLGLGAFFLHPNITGNAISGLAPGTSNLMGIILLLAGIVGFILFFKEGKKPEE